MKACSKCQAVKNLSEFARDRSRKDGREYVCKDCKKARAAAYIAANKEKIKAYTAAWYRENKDHIRDYGTKYRAENRDTVAARDSVRNAEYARSNPEKIAEKCARRKAGKRQRTPKWLTPEDIKTMRGFYQLAKRLQKDTGVKHHVDHVIPLQGERVSGLHVPANLQVLTASYNSSKGNSL